MHRIMSSSTLGSNNFAGMAKKTLEINVMHPIMQVRLSPLASISTLPFPPSFSRTPTIVSH
jgi:hypothetical protein